MGVTVVTVKKFRRFQSIIVYLFFLFCVGVRASVGVCAWGLSVWCVLWMRVWLVVRRLSVVRDWCPCRVIGSCVCPGGLRFWGGVGLDYSIRSRAPQVVLCSKLFTTVLYVSARCARSCVCGWRERTHKRASFSLSHFVGRSSLSVHMPIVPSVWRRSLRLLGLFRSFNANSA